MRQFREGLGLTLRDVEDGSKRIASHSETQTTSCFTQPSL